MLSRPGASWLLCALYTIITTVVGKWFNFGSSFGGSPTLILPAEPLAGRFYLFCLVLLTYFTLGSATAYMISASMLDMAIITTSTSISASTRE